VRPFDQVAFTRGCQLAFWVTVVISALGLIATLVLIRRDELATAPEGAVTAA
jgi:hypothetical protein